MAMSKPKKLIRVRHVHGANCKHDHGHDHGHAHDHGPAHDPGHDHGHAEAHGEKHVHGPGCNHDHGHGHDHGHHHHAPPKRIRPHGSRAAEGGGMALQLDLEGALPGETDEVGRFQKLEAALESLHGVTDVHLRRDLGHAEVCIHYQPDALSLTQLLALAQRTSSTVAARYLEHTWFVRGMDSADAATVIEHAVTRLPGVLSASVAYASERLVLEYDREECTLADVEAPREGPGLRARGAVGGPCVLAPRAWRRARARSWSCPWWWPRACCWWWAGSPSASRACAVALVPVAALGAVDGQRRLLRHPRLGAVAIASCASTSRR